MKEKEWEEEALRKINNLEAARLAIRGALATIRNLQDQNAGLKAQIQDQAGRHKTAENKISELTAQVDSWRQQAKKWEDEQKRRAAEEAQFRNNLRMQVRSEESVRIEQSRRQTEEDLARLQAELAQMTAAKKDRDEKWARLKKNLEQREADLLVAEREKVELANRYRHDGELLAGLRKKRG